MSNSSDPRVVVLTMLSQKSSSILHSLGRVSKSLEDQREAQLARLEKRMPQILDEVKHNGDRGSRCDHGELVAKALERISQQARTISVCQRIQSSLAFEEIHRREEGIAEPHANTFEWIFNQPELGFTDWASEKDGTSVILPVLNRSSNPHTCAKAS